jgi:hypothetical protein
LESSRLCPTSGRLPAALQIVHGPVDLLGRFFLWADSEARDRGVTLSFAPLEELVTVNRSNSDTWRPLVPLFDPAVGGIDAQTGFALLGRNDAGEVVATQAARLYDWSTTCFRDEAVSLRMFYADPTAALARGECCIVSAASATTLSGRIVFSGAGWYRPDYRGKGLATILPRISRAYAYTRWHTDCTISMFADAVLAGGMAVRCGYTNVEPASVELINSPIGTLRFALVSMATTENLADLTAILADATAREDRRSRAEGGAAQINSDVHDRSAEKARRA